MRAVSGVEWGQSVVPGEDIMLRIPCFLLLQTLLLAILLGLSGPVFAKGAQGKKDCKYSPPRVPPGPVGPLLRAVSILPAVHGLPKGTDQIALSALVALDDKNIVLLDGIEARKKGKRWVWDAVRATADGGRRRRDELRKVGVRPHKCPESPDKWL